ncbi:outer membrane protein bacterial [Actinomyces glycerinitolerans]|uniref:Outer membrane protein bacterial n=1 Tax=Actinomyces glycerinitolerans TaxID=1892869 RepID=A0A1M4RWP3_9ACTO|nr:outer membrane protein bacterial [Actinomyces glycerinitolerans]
MPVNSGPVVLDFEWRGEALTARVGPAVVQDGYTVVRVEVSGDVQDSFWLYGMLGRHTAAWTLTGAYLLSLVGGVAFREVTTNGGNESVEPGVPAEVFPVFGAVPDGLSSVDVFLPNVGVALGVPVVDAGEAGFDVGGVLAAAEFDDAVESGPFGLNSVVVAADGSSDTASDDVSTTVNVSGDVLFATDSAELSDQADEVLGAVVEQLELYPSGGSLAVTGHTDDVNTDEHNQDLSERRAQSVSDRLGGLADLSGWDVSVSGKGESEPRVPNDSDENRQLNRRVEVLLTPADPDEATGVAGGSSTGSGDMPEASGPVGRGPDGVDIEVDGVPARISLDSVTRVGDYLIGNVKIVAEQDATVSVVYLGIPTSMYSLREWGTYQSTGFSLLKGGQRYLLADFTDGEGENRPLTNFWSNDLVAGMEKSFPVVWPDTGEDTVTMDMPGGTNGYRPVLAVRLTDIPVVEG